MSNRKVDQEAQTDPAAHFSFSILTGSASGRRQHHKEMPPEKALAVIITTLLFLQLQVHVVASSEVISAYHNATGVEWPTLRLHFTVKRNSMKIHGQSQFVTHANPIVPEDGANALYDTKTSFMDGSMQHEYVLIKGVGYYFKRTSDRGNTTFLGAVSRGKLTTCHQSMQSRMP
ncbi:unnamed protein product [Phytophthora lilii]|uniref:Unnamed protein product n=1 Tax=Phytophthora lilii TaxID=2077276 RepID=A0A9W6WY29_9STRA|nr:unnamed protein product [Phytophthora lilii]